MKQTFIALIIPVIIALTMAFITSNAHAIVDLEFGDVGLDDYSYPPGDEVVIEYFMRNIGDDLSPGSTAKAYASTDTIITEDDYYLGDDYVDPLMPNGPALWQRVFGRFPDSIPPGEYYIGMISFCTIDANPNNDTYYDSTVVLIDNSIRPDLIVANVDHSGSNFHPGDSISLEVTVENIGVQKSGEYNIRCYASTDSSITEDDYYLGGDLGLKSLDSGQDRSISINGLCFPGDIPAGDYYVGAITSCPMETNLDNNAGYDGDTIKLHAYPPNIIVQSIIFGDIVYKPRSAILVDLVVKNTGIGRANSYDIDYYASTDDYIETTDYCLGSAYEGSLEPDEESSISTSCDFPDDIPNGDYYIGVIIEWSYDSGSGSTQGCNTDPVWVGVPVDLAVQSVAITPGAYLPGEEFVVYSLIENIGGWGAESYAVDYYASTDSDITTDDHHIGYVNRDSIETGEQHSYDTTYHIPFDIAAGDYYIGVIVTCPREYDLENNTGCSEETIELVHPADYVCGQMLYLTRWARREFPIRYALVEVYDADDDEDPLDDRVIGKTNTDQDGNYGIAVLNDEASSQNIYIKVFTESPIGAYPETEGKTCSVKDDVFDEIYYMKSDLYPHPRDLSVVVNMTAHEDSGEFMVYDSIVEGFHKAKTFFDVNLPEVTAFWPCEEETSYFDPCDQGMYISQGDRGDRDVIMHEYGHFIADVFAFTQGDVGDNPIHFWDVDLRYNPEDRNNEQARNLAFRESWATLFSIATQYGDNWYPYSGDTLYYDFDEESGYSLMIDLEKDTDNFCEPGEYYEHMNCCALWDIFDDNDDDVDDNDTLSDTNLSKIWSVFRDSQPDDIIDFWNGWFVSYDYTSEITRIFQDHGMSFEKPED